MAKHTYDVTIGDSTYTVESDSPLSDADAYAYAKSQVPLDVKAQNATARANMAKQPGEDEMRARASSEPWTPGAMLDRAKAGLKGEAEGFAGGLAAPAVLLYHAVRHPLETADAAEQTALALGAMGYQAVTKPGETFDAAKNAVVRFASDPENIGAAAGGVGAALVAPRLMKAAKGTKVGQAVAAGVSDAANRIPGVKVARAVLKPVAPAAPKVPKPTAAQVKAAEEAARLAQNGVVSTADAAASNPNVAAAARRAPIVDNTVPGALADPNAGLADAVQSKVVPLADDSARSLHTMEAPDVVNKGYGGYNEYSAMPDSVNDLPIVDNAGRPILPAGADDAVAKYLKEFTDTGQLPMKALVGNRTAGALPLAQREQLLRALLDRAAKAGQ